MTCQVDVYFDSKGINGQEEQWLQLISGVAFSSGHHIHVEYIGISMDKLTRMIPDREYSPTACVG